jgi:hypothetical protein
MRKLYFLLIALFFALPLYSQVLKTQAVIIFANNDSLSAEIKDEQLKNIQVRIQYRKPGSDNFVTGLPGLIKSVRFTDGRLFESVKTDSATVFLLRLIEGYYTLYAKVEKNGLNTYYLKHKQDTLIHLYETLTDQYVKVNGELRRLSNFEYVHQLSYAMADNGAITAKINDIKYREDELMAIVKQYNEFKGNIYRKDSNLKKKMRISTGILINYYPYSDIFESQAAGFGISFDFYRNRPYQKIGLKTRFVFNILEFTKNESYKFNIEVPLALSYNYLERTRLRLYFLGGITSLLFFDSETIDGKRNNSNWGSPSPYLGTGVDFKIKKSALRFEISILPLRYMLDYIF